MKVVFSHGKESGPNGSKIQCLRAVAGRLGLDSDSIDYRGLDDPEARVRMLLAALKQSEPGPRSIILVGSSMGAYVSARVMHDVSSPLIAGAFLLAPAVYMPGYESGEILPAAGSAAHGLSVSIVHGWDDDVVPWQNALRFAEALSADCHLLPDEHRLMGCLGQIESLFEHFLKARLLTASNGG